MVDTRSRAYRGYLFALASVPMLGLFVGFSRIQKVYAVVGALFIPMLALVLLVLNNRRSWVGELRNRWGSNAALLAALAAFALFGLMKFS